MLKLEITSMMSGSSPPVSPQEGKPRHRGHLRIAQGHVFMIRKITFANHISIAYMPVAFNPI